MGVSSPKTTYAKPGQSHLLKEIDINRLLNDK